jgi:dCTP diphosphatase
VGVGQTAFVDLEEVTRRVKLFADEREWGKFHTPKNLAMAVGAEVGELLDVFRWVSDDESQHPDETTRSLAEEEVADILILLVRLADVVSIDVTDAFERKMAQNEEKYPAARVRGTATKYSRRRT